MNPPASLFIDLMRPESGVRQTLALVLLLVLGLLTGAAAFALGQAETRWMAYALIGLFGVLTLVMTRDKHRLLSLAFLLGLQMDVYLRLSYGRAGSTEGIALAFVTMAGMALLLYRFFARGPTNPLNLRLDGIARKPLLAVLATTALSIVTTDERFIALSQLVFELQLFLVYWITYNLVQQEADLRRVVGVLMLILLIQSLVLFVENALGVNFSVVGEVARRGEVPRPGGTVSTNPAGFASFITPPLMLAITYFLARGSQWRPRGALIVALLGLAAIGLTFTRASWAGTVLGMVAVVFFLRRRSLVRWDRVFVILAMTALAAIALLPTMTERLSNDYGSHVNAQSAAWEERWGLMRIAFNVIAHHPVTGIGAGAYMYTYKEYIPSGMHQWTSAVHNEFLLRTAETGLLGGIAFVALIIAGLRIGLRLARSPRLGNATLGAAWIAALLSLIWQMSWVPWTGFCYNAMLWFMLGLMDAACRLDSTASASAAGTGNKNRNGPPLPAQG